MASIAPLRLVGEHQRCAWISPSDIITKDGSPVDFTGKRIGLYFSAHVRIQRLIVSSSP